MLASSQGEELPALDPLAAFAVRPPHPTTSSPLLAPATSTNELRRLAPPLSLASSPWTCTLPGAPPPEIARPQPPPGPETQRHPSLEPVSPPLATAAVPRPSSAAREPPPLLPQPWRSAAPRLDPSSPATNLLLCSTPTSRASRACSRPAPWLGSWSSRRSPTSTIPQCSVSRRVPPLPPRHGRRVSLCRTSSSCLCLH
nr:proline-rich receptor-like protein kinase PERK2 [Aegilops tauschii subsp. strangulata]